MPMKGFLRGAQSSWVSRMICCAANSPPRFHATKTRSGHRGGFSSRLWLAPIKGRWLGYGRHLFSEPAQRGSFDAAQGNTAHRRPTVPKHDRRQRWHFTSKSLSGKLSTRQSLG